MHVDETNKNCQLSVNTKGSLCQAYGCVHVKMQKTSSSDEIGERELKTVYINIDIPFLL